MPMMLQGCFKIFKPCLMNKASLLTLFLIFLSFLLMTIACDTVNYRQGQILYDANCATCHMPDGSGVARLYPSLVPFSQNGIEPGDMPCIIRQGQDSDKYSLAMSGLPHLSDIEINNIVNYILHDLNHKKEEFSIDNTRSKLANCSIR